MHSPKTAPPSLNQIEVSQDAETLLVPGWRQLANPEELTLATEELLLLHTAQATEKGVIWLP